MGMSGDTALIQAKRYVKKTLEGQGALKGKDGFSPTVKENPSNTDNDYRLDITDKNGTITTPNLKGADGSGSDYKQLKNKPSINGVEIDGNKTLDDLGIQQKGEYITEETDPTVPQWAKENTKPTYTASEVGADSAGSADMALSNAKGYTNNKIAELINGAPETMDTLKEIADALETEQSTVEVLQEAIGAKLNKDGDSKDNTVTFVQSETRENIDSGDKHSVLFGKIRKWLFDLKEVAFSGSYTDLNNKPSAEDIGALPKDGNATSATKATNDGDGNNIAETYATKVQVGEINSNLDTLEFGEIAGGKNLFNGKLHKGYWDSSTGKKVDSTNWICNDDLIKVRPNTNYIASGVNTTTFEVVFLDSNKNGISQASAKVSFTTPSNAEYIGVYFSSNGTYSNIQIEEGNVATPYEPYIPSVKMLASENAQQTTEAMDLKMLGWTVPKECPIQNYVDSDGVFHQIVGRVDMSDLSWDFNSEKVQWVTSDISNIIKSSISDDTIMPNVYSQNQPIAKTANQVWGGEEGIGVSSAGFIYYKDSNTSANNKPTGYLYFELATEKTISVDGNETVTKVNDSLGEYDVNENATGSYSGSSGFALPWTNIGRATKGTYKLSYTISGSTGSSSEISLGKATDDKSLYDKSACISDGIYEQIINITSDTDVYMMAYTNGTFTISDIKFTLQNIANEVGNLKNDLEALKDAIIAMGGTV